MQKVVGNYTTVSRFCLSKHHKVVCVYICQVKWIVLTHTVQHTYKYKYNEGLQSETGQPLDKKKTMKK